MVHMGSMTLSQATFLPKCVGAACRLGSSVKHYAKLMVAEHPVKEHRKYKQGQEVRTGSRVGLGMLTGRT